LSGCGWQELIKKRQKRPEEELNEMKIRLIFYISHQPSSSILMLMGDKEVIEFCGYVLNTDPILETMEAWTWRKERQGLE
jgi:hypothetical protein